MRRIFSMSFSFMFSIFSSGTLASEQMSKVSKSFSHCPQQEKVQPLNASTTRLLNKVIHLLNK